MTWVIDNKAAGNQRQLGRIAGLNPSHLSAMFWRLRNKKKTTVEVATLEKIATATGVSVAWLVSGHGQPGEGITDAPRAQLDVPASLAALLVRYPNRWPKDLVSEVASGRLRDARMGEVDWFAYLTDRVELDARYLEKRSDAPRSTSRPSKIA